MIAIKKQLFLTTVLALLQILGNCSTHQDSIAEYENMVIVKKRKFLLDFDSRQSFVLKQSVKMTGLRIGMEFRKKFRLGFGFYRQNALIIIGNKTIKNESNDIFLTLNYATIFAEYILYQNYRWATSFTTSSGLGTRTIIYKNLVSNKEQLEKTEGVPVFTSSITGYYNIKHWLAVGGGFGFRKVLRGDANFKKVFDSPIYIFKIKLMLGRIIKGIVNPKQIKAERYQYRKAKGIRRRKKRQNYLNKLKD